MNDKIGLMYVKDANENQEISGSQPFSDALGALIDTEARSLVQKAHNKATKILSENLDKLNMVSPI